MKKRKEKIQYIEIPITQKALNELAKFLYGATTGKKPIWSIYRGIPAMVGDEIDISIHGFQEIVLKFKVVADSYSIQELRELLNQSYEKRNKSS
jgi:hypothetical protein